MQHIKTVSFSRNIILGAAYSIAITSCGSKKAEDTPAPVVYGNMTISGSTTATDNASYQLTSVDVCTSNADSGRVDIAISQGLAKPALKLALKNFSSTPKTYTCAQASDNHTTLNELGLKFESCMVDAKGWSTTDASSLNGYTMYRETTSTQLFTYTGICTIEVTATTPTITGKVNCVDAVQTFRSGSLRNPVEAEVNADITGDFKCTFQ